MNLKIAISLATVTLASGAMGYGTFAFLSDTETSAGNLFAAGSLDLALGGVDGTSATFASSNFAPGDSVTGSVLLRNTGTIRTGDAQGHVVDLDLKAAFTVVDDEGNPEDPDDGGVSTIGLDKYLTITALTYGGSDILARVGDADGDGRANTLADLAARAITDLDDPGEGRAVALTVKFAEDGPNHLKRDAVELDLSFLLAQAGEVDLS